MSDTRDLGTCPCGAKISAEVIPDAPGSKSGHVRYLHIPGPPCETFMSFVETAIRRQQGAKIMGGGSKSD